MSESYKYEPRYPNVGWSRAQAEVDEMHGPDDELRVNNPERDTTDTTLTRTFEIQEIQGFVISVPVFDRGRPPVIDTIGNGLNPNSELTEIHEVFSLPVDVAVSEEIAS